MTIEIDPRLASDRSWIQCYSGLPFWPLDPRPEDVRVEDVAAALSKIPRFTGHTSGEYAYSVAQHSFLVSQQGLGDDALWGLLHDASEAYLLDLPRPLKDHPAFEPYRRVEAAVMRAVCTRFGLPEREPESVRRADLVLLATEARDLMGDPDWGRALGVEPLPRPIYPMRPTVARRWFLEQFEVLVARREEGR